MEGLSEFMDEITRIVEDGDRQYGVANARFTEYFIERIELCIVTCSDLRDRMQDDGSGRSSRLLYYTESVDGMSEEALS